uniref:PTS system, cellobiose-specific IIA component n=1 Tax=Eubacterium plexicaudatum ASF492 TaxID=1235802 RepID=N2B7T6_9FIRM
MFTHEMVKSFNQLEMDVYNYIVQNEDKVIYMKVRELADVVHVSTTTVLRFCKKAGCEGYSEFRLKLKQELKDSRKIALDMDITAMNDFFQRAQTKAFQENMKEAMDYLIKSTSVIFVGVGNSSIMGKYGARYFNNVVRKRMAEVSEQFEMLCFQVITFVGTARTHFINAIQSAKAGNFDEAENLIKEGDSAFSQGHNGHADLLTMDANGELSGGMMLLMHAEDQLMSAENFRILAKEFIELYRKLEEKNS